MTFALKHIFARDIYPHIQNIVDLLAKLEGKLEVAEKLLKEKIELAFIEKIKGLSTKDIKALQKKLN